MCNKRAELHLCVRVSSTTSWQSSSRLRVTHFLPYVENVPVGDPSNKDKQDRAS